MFIWFRSTKCWIRQTSSPNGKYGELQMSQMFSNIKL